MKSEITGDYVLIATGRKPYTTSLNLEKAGVVLDKFGRIPVDSNYMSKTKGIFAIGDVIEGPMLAHKGEEEGVACIENIIGEHGHVNYNVIPNVVYTHPEIASVGLSEEEVKAKGITYKKGKFPFLANSRAKCNEDFDGFVKVISDKETDKILGVHIIGPNASDLIAEAAVAMEFKAAAEDIARICHPHPSLSEVVREAALATDKRALNM